MIRVTFSPRRRVAATVLAVAVATTGCVRVSPPQFMTPLPTRQWPAALDNAQAATVQGRFDVADSVLVAFAARYPDTREALESEYWRAVFALDPANHGGAFAVAIVSLDRYLTDRRPRSHVPEATSLRRVAGQLDVLTRLAATHPQPDSVTVARVTEPKPAAKPEPKSDGKGEVAAAEAEIKRLKDELAKANAELERIRRRLAVPPKSR